ncbi:MAG: carboxylesterase family protein [Pseudomonadota bacterium]
MSESLAAVQAPAGHFQGLPETGLTKFLGVRYAAAPVGDLRFKAPVALPPSSEPIDATRFGGRSFDIGQPEQFTAMFDVQGEQGEDCLFLNIYVPTGGSTNKPVMFWIHGGAFIGGSGNQYDPSNLARKNDVIVVTVNYRLGIFGFLNLQRLGPGYEASANLGIADQIAALNWVNENIAAFGGDPLNVTIFGESAGAASVFALMGAPSANGLFQKAAAFSGGETLAPAMDYVDILKAHFGVETDQATLDALLAMPAAELSQLQQDLRLYFGSSLDGVVITRPTCEAIKDGSAASVPILTGATKDEGTLLAPYYSENEQEANLTLMGLSASIGRDDGSTYWGHLHALMPEASMLEKMTHVWFDLFRASALRVASTATQHGAGGWVYNFEIETEDPMGTTHGSDIPFIFDWTDPADTIFFVHDASESNRRLADQWSKTVVAFARDGEPNGAGLPSWPKYGPEAFQCLRVAQQPEIIANPDGEMLKTYSVV